ncbi:hypothetical protein K8374_09545 [Pseudomonas sp. p1(2021b)]|uniref:hypothetical protein n=1 Tax=Pseudomonas sp. p1(2021b) TaxID=2874628 RepID=UPI001CCE9521|nr:hypothetical protein [Pseudomonas sp. p1(2021b)]UBM27174.1 hypothetical protein K8374_09545 [Pseudomonas sp. p1(2021b)]
MSTWAKLQQTIGELRAELNSVQATTGKLDAALAERADKARKYTSADGAVELDLDPGVFKLGGFAMGSLPSDPQMITVTAGEWSESDLPSNAIERYKFIGNQVMSIPAEHRDGAEFSTEDMSFDRDGSDIRTTLTYRRLETEQEAAERAARQSGSGVTINADDVTIMANGKVVARLGRCMDDKQPAEQPFAVKDDQVFVSQAAIDQFATKAQIVEEASARASADKALAKRIGALEAKPCRADDGDDALRNAFEDWKPGTALLSARGSTAIDRFAVRMANTSNGQYVCTGVGLGIDPTKGETKDGQTDMEQAIEKGDVSQALLKLASSIAESNLGLELRSKIDAADPVREVIRKELRPGGLLYRR